MTIYTRRAAQRAQLLQVGRKGIELMNKGYDVQSALMVLGVSRAKYYRAINAATKAAKPAPTIDPMLA